jgi:hypothetical protein
MMYLHGLRICALVAAALRGVKPGPAPLAEVVENRFSFPPVLTPRRVRQYPSRAFWRGRACPRRPFTPTASQDSP